MLQFNEVDAPQSTKLLLATESRFSHFVREFTKFENESLGYVEIFTDSDLRFRVVTSGRNSLFCQIIDPESGNVSIGRTLSTYFALEYLYHGIQMYQNSVISFRDLNVLHDNMVFVY